MLLFGGYPEPWLAAEPAPLLAGLVESVVVRDASDLFRIDAPEPFRRLLRLMAGQVGSLVNLAEWAAICGVSAKTVARYAAILEEAHIVRLLPPWLSGRRAELTSTPKVFFVDNGIRNAVLGRFLPLDRRDDGGPLLENQVFGELAKVAHPLLDSLGYWRTRSGAEVDLVWQQGEEVVGLEVKAGGGLRNRLPRTARSFIEAARPRAFITVRPGARHEQTVSGCQALWLPPAELPEVLRGFRRHQAGP
jgi:predicted AAA+ superfamily ATPase